MGRGHGQEKLTPAALGLFPGMQRSMAAMQWFSQSASAAQVAVDGRRCGWRNSAMAIHIALPNSLFDQLGSRHLPRDLNPSPCVGCGARVMSRSGRSRSGDGSCQRRRRRPRAPNPSVGSSGWRPSCGPISASARCRLAPALRRPSHLDATAPTSPTRHERRSLISPVLWRETWALRVDRTNRKRG